MLFTASATAQDSRSRGLRSEDFNFTASLSAPDGREIVGGALYMVSLSSEVLRLCHPDFSDLRLLDGYGGSETETPFTVLERTPPANHPPMELLVVSRDRDGDTCTLVLAKPGNVISLSAPVSALEFPLPERDFFAYAEVWGSYDKEQWTPLARDALYSFRSTAEVGKTRISFPASDHPYFKLALDFQETLPAELASASNRFPDLEPLAQDRILFAPELENILALPATADPTPLDRAIFSNLSQGQEGEDTVLMVEARLPALEMTLDPATPFFLRKVSVLASDLPEAETFLPLCDSLIYRFPVMEGRLESTTIALDASTHRYYRIIIHDQGRDPLEVSSIALHWRQRMLFFSALADRAEYSLWFQRVNPEENIPVRPYDLSSRVRPDNWRDSGYTRLDLGDVRRNLKVQALEFQRGSQHKALFNWIVALLCIAATIWLFVILKRTHGGKEPR